MITVLLTASGISQRMGQDIPKQFMHVDNRPIIIHTMEAFQNHPNIDAIMVVTLPAWGDVLKAYAKQFNITKLKWVVHGGKTNQESIYNGLQELRKTLSGDDVVIIHDGNRPMISQEIISDSIAVFHKYGSAVAAIPCVEAIFKSDDGVSSCSAIPREQLYRTQTPHTYTLDRLLQAHDQAGKKGISNTTATCTLMQQLGENIYFSKGSEENIKITTVDDLIIFKALLHTKKDNWLK